MFKLLLLIGAGGFAGSISRHLLSRAITLNLPTVFPLGTFAVNITGCLLLGLLMGSFLNRGSSEALKMFWLVGFCGGFTTFSTFSLEIVQSFNDGGFLIGAAYALLSVLLGFLAVIAGLWIAGAE